MVSATKAQKCWGNLATGETTHHQHHQSGNLGPPAVTAVVAAPEALAALRDRLLATRADLVGRMVGDGINARFLNLLAGIAAAHDALVTVPADAEPAEREPSSLRSSTQLNFRAKSLIEDFSGLALLFLKREGNWRHRIIARDRLRWPAMTAIEQRRRGRKACRVWSTGVSHDGG